MVTRCARRARRGQPYVPVPMLMERGTRRNIRVVREVLGLEKQNMSLRIDVLENGEFAAESDRSERILRTRYRFGSAEEKQPLSESGYIFRGPRKRTWVDHLNISRRKNCRRYRRTQARLCEGNFTHRVGSQKIKALSCTFQLEKRRTHGDANRRF